MKGDVYGVDHGGDGREWARLHKMRKFWMRDLRGCQGVGYLGPHVRRQRCPCSRLLHCSRPQSQMERVELGWSVGMGCGSVVGQLHSLRRKLRDQAQQEMSRIQPGH